MVDTISLDELERITRRVNAKINLENVTNKQQYQEKLDKYLGKTFSGLNLIDHRFPNKMFETIDTQRRIRSNIIAKIPTLKRLPTEKIDFMKLIDVEEIRAGIRKERYLTNKGNLSIKYRGKGGRFISFKGDNMETITGVLFYIISCYAFAIGLYFVSLKNFKNKGMFGLAMNISPQLRKQAQIGLMVLLIFAPIFVPIFIVGFAYNKIVK